MASTDEAFGSGSPESSFSTASIPMRSAAISSASANDAPCVMRSKSGEYARKGTASAVSAMITG
jgi:hypothetical protein